MYFSSLMSLNRSDDIDNSEREMPNIAYRESPIFMHEILPFPRISLLPELTSDEANEDIRELLNREKGDQCKPHQQNTSENIETSESTEENNNVPLLECISPGDSLVAKQKHIGDDNNIAIDDTGEKNIIDKEKCAKKEAGLSIEENEPSSIVDDTDIHGKKNTSNGDSIIGLHDEDAKSTKPPISSKEDCDNVSFSDIFHNLHEKLYIVDFPDDKVRDNLASHLERTHQSGVWLINLSERIYPLDVFKSIGDPSSLKNNGKNQEEQGIDDSHTKKSFSDKTINKGNEAPLSPCTTNDELKKFLSIGSNDKTAIPELSRVVSTNVSTDIHQHTTTFHSFRCTPIHFKALPAPPIKVAHELCCAMFRWFLEKPNGVILIHCFRGYSRSTVLLACFLRFCGVFKSMESAADHVGLSIKKSLERRLEYLRRDKAKPIDPISNKKVNDCRRDGRKEVNNENSSDYEKLESRTDSLHYYPQHKKNQLFGLASSWLTSATATASEFISIIPSVNDIMHEIRYGSGERKIREIYICPSQYRYISYYERLLISNWKPHSPFNPMVRFPAVSRRTIVSLVLCGVPCFEQSRVHKSRPESSENDIHSDSENASTDIIVQSTFRPFLEVWANGNILHTTFPGDSLSLPTYTPSDGCVVFNLNTPVSGDALIRISHWNLKEKAALSCLRAAFNVDMLPDYCLHLEKAQLDSACVDKRFPNDCFVDIIFEADVEYTMDKSIQMEEALRETRLQSARAHSLYKKTVEHQRSVLSAARLIGQAKNQRTTVVAQHQIHLLSPVDTEDQQSDDNNKTATEQKKTIPTLGASLGSHILEDDEEFQTDDWWFTE